MLAGFAPSLLADPTAEDMALEVRWVTRAHVFVAAGTLATVAVGSDFAQAILAAVWQSSAGLPSWPVLAAAGSGEE